MRTEDLRVEVSQEEPAPTDGLRESLRFALWVFVGVRVGLSLVALAGVGLLPGLEPVGVPGWPAPDTTQGWHNLVTVWERFDGLWFLRIGTTGYIDGDGSAAFFPLYPLSIRVLSPLLGGPLAAALVVSNAAFYGSLVLLHRLTAFEFDRRVARRAVVYLAVFPTSFFFLAPYSESLFLFLTLGALYSARRGHWELAGAAGALAAATRNVGVLLVLPLVVEAVLQARERRADPVRAVAWAVVPALGTLAYMAFWQRLSGDWLAPLHQQATWQRELSAPWETVVTGTREAFRWIGLYPGGYHLVDWMVVAPALAAAVWVAMRARPTYAVYAWASLVAPLSFIFPLRPFMSLPRFLLAVFPLLWAPAVWAARHRLVHEAVLVSFAALLGVLTVLFAGWYYIF